MKGFGYIYETYPTVANTDFYERYLKREKLKTPWVSPKNHKKEKVKK
jgi:hypothetical protein